MDSPIASDSRAMPLAVTVTTAGANDGCQTHKVLAALVVRPPAPEVPTDTPDTPDERGRPTARADGAYGNEPSRERAASQGFRMQATRRGKKRPGIGKVPNAVERRHNFFAQFGRRRAEARPARTERVSLLLGAVFRGYPPSPRNLEAGMPTLTIEYTTEAERLQYERAIAYVQERNRPDPASTTVC